MQTRRSIHIGAFYKSRIELLLRAFVCERPGLQHPVRRQDIRLAKSASRIRGDCTACFPETVNVYAVYAFEQHTEAPTQAWVAHPCNSACGPAGEKKFRGPCPGCLFFGIAECSDIDGETLQTRKVGTQLRYNRTDAAMTSLKMRHHLQPAWRGALHRGRRLYRRLTPHLRFQHAHHAIVSEERCRPTGAVPLRAELAIRAISRPKFSGE